MHLISLATTNFKKLGNFNCEFSDGLNIIAGENFKGKSTLLQAIHAAFFGPSVIPGKVANVPTWGSKDFKIELMFSIKGETYSVSRSMKTAKLVCVADGTLQANGTTAVNEKIEELLGLSAADYSLFWQSKQGESAGMLTFGATALNRKVEEFAGVELIDKVQTLAQRKSTQLRASADAKAVDAESLEAAELANQQAEADWNTASIEHDNAVQAVKEHVQPELLPIVNTVSTLTTLRREADQLWSQVELATHKAQSTKAALETAKASTKGMDLKDEDKLRAALAQAAAGGTKNAEELKELKAALTKWQNAERDLSAAQQRHDADIAAVKAVKEGYDEKATATTRKTVEGLQSTWEEASAATTTAYAKVQSISAMKDGAACPTCGQARGEHDPEQLAKELDEATDLWSGLKNTQAGAKAALDTAAKTLRVMEQKDGDVAAAQRAYESSKTALATAQAALDEQSPGDLGAGEDLQTAITDLEEVIAKQRDEYAAINADLKSASEHNTRLRALEATVLKATADAGFAEQELAALEKQWEELPEPPTDVEIDEAAITEAANRKTMEDWRTAHAQLENNVKLAATMLASAANLVDLTKKRVDELFERSQQALADADAAAKHSRLVSFLRDRRQEYLKEVWTTVLTMASKLVRDASDNTITSVTNEDGAFWFEEDGVLTPIDSASGAQKSFIGVALRIALARGLYGSDSPLIFDEPTESCSELYASSLAAAISTSAKQVLLITHRENDQALAQNIINVG